MVKLYSTAEAAGYLGEDVGVIKYNYYITGKLEGSLKGNSLIFTKADLDEFQAKRKGRGRPPKQIARVQKALDASGVEGEVVVKRRRFVHIAQHLADGQQHIIRLERPPSQMSHREMVANVRRASK